MSLPGYIYIGVSLNSPEYRPCASKAIFVQTLLGTHHIRVCPSLEETWLLNESLAWGEQVNFKVRLEQNIHIKIN